MNTHQETRLQSLDEYTRQVKVYDATSSSWFEQASEYWNQAILLAPSNYIEAHNWLKMTGGF
ncbi:hypothetical protein MPTK2_3g09610 [Marchantia polymorpha subsp. ruderalis]